MDKKEKEEIETWSRFINNHFSYILKELNLVTRKSVFKVLNKARYEPRHEKPDFCICEYKDADQLRGNRESNQRLCFRYADSTIPLLSESEISSI